MIINLDIFRTKALSSNLEESVSAIDALIQFSDQIKDILLESLSKTSNRFVISERISMFCLSYIKGLHNLLHNQDTDLKFWAAALMMHYNLNNPEAEKILLENISQGPIDYATAAATILCRIKNVNVSNAIKIRLTDNTLTKELKDFFIEKLDNTNL